MALLGFEGGGLAFELGGGGAVIHPTGGEESEQTGGRGKEERLARAVPAPLRDGRRHQVQFHRARAELAQRDPDQFAEAVAIAGDLFFGELRPERDIAQGIEVFDGEAEFLLEKLLGVGERGAAPGEEDQFRCAAPLLAAVEVRRAHDLAVRARQRIADDFRKRRQFGIIVVRIAGQCDKPGRNLPLLRLGEIKREFLGDAGGHRRAGHIRNAPEKEFPARLDVNQIARARPEIDQKRRLAQIRVIETKGIVERERRDVDRPQS